MYFISRQSKSRKQHLNVMITEGHQLNHLSWSGILKNILFPAESNMAELILNGDDRPNVMCFISL